MNSEQDSHLEQLIEAALFMSSRSLSLYELLKITDSETPKVKAAIKNLQTDYETRGSWLEIIRVDKSYLMRLKPERTDRISSFVQETELSKRALRILAVVAQRDGILQSKVVKMLGTTVYDAVPELVEKGYLRTEVKGHSKVLKLTPKFKEYFGEIPVGNLPEPKQTAAPQPDQPEAEPQEAPQEETPSEQPTEQPAEPESEPEETEKKEE